MTAAELTDFLRRAAEYPSLMQQTRNRLIGCACRKAAVLIGVVWHEEQWQIVMTRRADSLRHHTGQIALPGGRQDAQDADANAAALRETHEETGINSNQWQIFAPLPPHYSPSGYEVHPVAALCRHSPTTQPNADEVAEIFYLPLEVALDSSRYAQRPLTVNGQTISVPALPFRHYDIWGLTAAVLYGLAERYQLFLKDKNMF